MSYPSFDDLRYLDPWLNLVERHGKENAIKSLIVWQTLNRWEVKRWSYILVYVFGSDAEDIAKQIIEAPEVVWNEMLAGDNRFEIIKGDYLFNRIIAYCNLVIQETHKWLLYDP